MIVVVNYGMGNLRSVEKKLNSLKSGIVISSDLEVIKNASKLILPGVGHFANGMKNIKDYNLEDILNEKVLVEKIPILGICLGMQIMTKKSEEGDVAGFGWFDAEVLRFNVIDKLRYKIPHMGWNNINTQKQSILLENITEKAMFYFVHSYYVHCNKKDDILTTSTYEDKFVSSIQKDNIYGVQYHPEKSYDLGEEVFRNFVNL
jgi:glutamine amidotransferase